MIDAVFNNIIKVVFTACYNWFVFLVDSMGVWPYIVGMFFTILVFRFLLLPAFQREDFSNSRKKGDSD